MTTPSEPASSNNQPVPDAAAQAAAASAAAQSTEAKAAADAAAAATSQASEKAAADKAAADKAAADAAAAAKPAAAPEKYEAFAVPDGVVIDAPTMQAFEASARELGLPQDKAQALIDKVAPAMKAQGEAAFATMKTDMLAAAKADAEIGGEKFDESVATAKLAIETYFTPNFAKFLNESGLGNHPEMIRGLRKAGLPLKQDGHIAGNKDGAPLTNAKGFYNNSSMNE